MPKIQVGDLRISLDDVGAGEQVLEEGGRDHFGSLAPCAGRLSRVIPVTPAGANSGLFGGRGWHAARYTARQIASQCDPRTVLWRSGHEPG